MSRPKVFIVGYVSAQLERYFESNGVDVTKDPFKADFFQFMGGEDVTPAIYGEENHHSHNSFDRDLFEMGYYALAKRLNKPMVGICRGGQFLNVMCGGSMHQHVNGHTNSHDLYLINAAEDYKVIQCTSTHHQMMKPDYEAAELLAYADIVTDSDAEVVWYEADRCLCFQPHPEYEVYPELTTYYFDLINNLLLETA